MNSKYYLFTRKIIIVFSISLLCLSIFLQTKELYTKQDYNLTYEYINVKDMAQVNISNKEQGELTLLRMFTGNTNSIDSGNLMEVDMSSISNATPVEVEMPSISDSQATAPATPTWRLPTEMGYVTQYPHYGHVAFDISSSRTYSEPIFPIANGVISGIYKDSAGALIVTIRHDINGQVYTSQYVHMWKYADGLYVGKPVTVNDAIGLMGSTGKSTGPHLHIAVLDCALFDSNDNNCRDLNAWFRYGTLRINQGFNGLGSVMNVPGSWNSR